MKFPRSMLIAATATATATAALAVSGPALAHHPGHEGEPVKALKGTKLSVSTRPAPGGVLVHARTRHFRWAPEHMSPVHGEGKVIRGEGHGHIYVDGATMPTLMIVGPWTYLPLQPGKHTVRVTLNANNHEEYQLHGHTVQDTVHVTINDSGDE
jgi:hypothetical protein